MEVVNLYKMAQDIIEQKNKFKARYDNAIQSTYNKLDYEIWLEHIMEMEDYYVEMCMLYQDDIRADVLEW